MNTLFYILEANLYLALFAAFYYFALRKETNYLANRWVLITSIILAWSIPAISFQVPVAEILTAIELETITLSRNSIVEVSGFSSQSVILWVYLFGVIVASTVFASSLIRVLILAGKYPRKNHGKFRFIETDNADAWSFFNLICLGKNIPDESRDWILEHEKVHAGELHTVDKIFIQLVKTFGWFNPAAYYLEFALEQNHEYRVDEVICSKFSDTISYSQILVSQSLGGVPTNLLAHEFSKNPLLKSRIQMINQTKQTGKMKYLLTIPVLAVALLLHGCTKEEADKTVDSNPEMSSLIAQNPDNDVFEVVEKMPKFEGGMDGLIAYMTEETIYPKASDEEGKVLVSFIVDEEGNVTEPAVIDHASSESAALRTAALETVGKMPAWTPGEQSGKKVKVKMTLPIQFVLD